MIRQNRQSTLAQGRIAVGGVRVWSALAEPPDRGDGYGFTKCAMERVSYIP